MASIPSVTFTKQRPQKTNLIIWIDNIFRGHVPPGVNIFDVDGRGSKVHGSYSGLRSGEGGKIIAEITSSQEIDAWRTAMKAQAPPHTCGTAKVVDGIAGRGNNTSSFPSLGPFISY